MTSPATISMSSLVNTFDMNGIFYAQDKLKNQKDLVLRIINVALPLICMHQVGSIAVYCTFQAIELTSCLKKTATNPSRENLLNSARIVSKVAFAILLPHCHLLTVHAFNLSSSFQKCYHHIASNNLQAAVAEALSFLHALVNIGLIVLGGQELLVISLLFQALKELQTAAHEFKKDRYLETIASLLFALLRIHAAIPHALSIQRNWYGKEMTQSDFDQLLNVVKDGQPNDQLVDFEDLLIKNDFKNRIARISFGEQKITNILFKNLTFQNVNLKDCWIERSHFQNVTFTECDFKGARLIRSVFESTLFTDSMMQGAEFNWSYFLNTTFKHSDLTAAVFNDSSLVKNRFIDCGLMESTFFKANVNASVILNSNLQDALLFETKDHFYISGGVANVMTRPVICLLYRFDKRSISAKAMDDSIKDLKGVVFRLHAFPQDVNEAILKQEVEVALKNYQTKPEGDDRSALQFLIENAKSDSEVGKIKDFSLEISKHINGLVIPGGDDVEPEFYSQARIPETDTYHTPSRTIFESSMLFSAETKKIPTLTICRGTQVLNVAFGGTLKQDIPGHWGVFHLLKLTKETLQTKTGHYVEQILKGPYMVGHSKHHQACDDVPSKFDVPLSHEGSPELLVSHMEDKDQHPIFVGLQFHPEMTKFDEDKVGDHHGNNNNFFENLLARVNYWTSVNH